MSPTNPPDNNNRPASNYAKYSGIGIQMIVIIGVFCFAGYKIDQYAGHKTQWVTALLSLTGVFVSLYIVIKSLKQ
ncbi:putative F0F1-ATPase subunit (Ca2+/Mg2+ transporter) [Mucilaginibacter gracilis]|uniref:Putative F0F1-ATPase subunit (Ca2+/Mg2+ transporter) n=1 Tax=Mucilaginibacter gracilis TaxID=423350 RepID=A0A495IZX3_9SPHI|nr:AtpZ/AtpI family protein [Mucilaginibacter gracilis]RKR81668.1 putative F0F1-ATPase subunit (Ca2+/Mg2+ transporter) [Mucilaginibacter gracilis]